MKRKPSMTFTYKGLIERLRGFMRYSWTGGYSAGQTMPWLTKKECRAMAKREGCVAEFVEER